MDLREYANKDQIKEISALCLQLQSHVDAFMKSSLNPLVEVEELKWTLVHALHPTQTVSKEQLYTILFP
jgi:hypothetical protein